MACLKSRRQHRLQNSLIGDTIKTFKIPFKKKTLSQSAYSNKKRLPANVLTAFLFECPGSDLNRYDRCGSQDFKSCVSTNSTTRAPKKISRFRREKFGAEDRARTGHPDLGKVVLYQMSYFRF